MPWGPFLRGTLEPYFGPKIQEKNPAMGNPYEVVETVSKPENIFLQSNGFTICVFLYKTEGCTRVWQGDHRTNQNIEQRKRLQFNGKRP